MSQQTNPKDTKQDDPYQAFVEQFMSAWRNTLDFTGVPMDVLLVMLYRYAADRELPAGGKMVQYGANANFVPDDATLEAWLTDYLKTAEEVELRNQHNLAEAGSPGDAPGPLEK